MSAPREPPHRAWPTQYVSATASATTQRPHRGIFRLAPGREEFGRLRMRPLRVRIRRVYGRRSHGKSYGRAPHDHRRAVVRIAGRKGAAGVRIFCGARPTKALQLLATRHRPPTDRPTPGAPRRRLAGRSKWRRARKRGEAPRSPCSCLPNAASARGPSRLRGVVRTLAKREIKGRVEPR